MGWVCGGPLSFYRVSLVFCSTMFVNCGVLCGMLGIISWTASETCRVVKNKPNKQNKLHLVGIL